MDSVMFEKMNSKYLVLSLIVFLINNCFLFNNYVLYIYKFNLIVLFILYLLK